MALILLVDDSMFSRKMTARMLAKAGHEVFEAENGLMGLKALMTKSPDCIVTDILMPEMDGQKFFITLRARGVKVPVVFLTADVQAKTRSFYLELGAVDVLNKPPSEDILLTVVEKALGEKI